MKLLFTICLLLILSPFVSCQSGICIFQQPQDVGICGGTSTICAFYLHFMKENNPSKDMQQEEKPEMPNDLELDKLVLIKLKIMLDSSVINLKGNIKSKFQNNQNNVKSKFNVNNVKTQFNVKKEKKDNSIKDDKILSIIQPKLKQKVSAERQDYNRNKFNQIQSIKKIRHYSVLPKDYGQNIKQIQKRSNQKKINIYPFLSSNPQISKPDYSKPKLKDQAPPRENKIILPLIKREYNNIGKDPGLKLKAQQLEKAKQIKDQQISYILEMVELDLKEKGKIDKGIEMHENSAQKTETETKTEIKYPSINLTKKQFSDYPMILQYRLKLLYKIETVIESLWKYLEKIDYLKLIQFVSSFFDFQAKEIIPNEFYPKDTCLNNPCVITVQFNGDNQGNHVIYAVPPEQDKHKMFYGRDQQNNNALLKFKHSFWNKDYFINNLVFFKGDKPWDKSKRTINYISVFTINKKKIKIK